MVKTVHWQRRVGIGTPRTDAPLYPWGGGGGAGATTHGDPDLRVLKLHITQTVMYT